MDNFLDRLEQLSQREATEIRKRRAAEEKRRLELEKESLNRLSAHERAKGIAIADRQTTLDMAWVAAELLNLHGVQPEYWLRNDPVVETRGIFRRERQTGTRRSIVAEGWPIARWQYLRFQPFPTDTLLLTPRSNIKGTYLMHFIQNRRGMYSYGELRDVDPGDVHPVGKVPLVKDDMEWPNGWPEPAYEGALPELRYSAEGTYLRSSDTGEDSNYDRYNKVGIERRIQQSIGRVIAKHTIVGSERVLEAVNASALLPTKGQNDSVFTGTSGLNKRVAR